MRKSQVNFDRIYRRMFRRWKKKQALQERDTSPLPLESNRLDRAEIIAKAIRKHGR